MGELQLILEVDEVEQATGERAWWDDNDDAVVAVGVPHQGLDDRRVDELDRSEVDDDLRPDTPLEIIKHVADAGRHRHVVFALRRDQPYVTAKVLRCDPPQLHGLGPP